MDFLNSDMTISIRRFAAVALLLSSTLTWFYIFHAYLLEELLKSVEGVFFIIGLGKLFFYSLAVIAGIIGSLISERVERRESLGYWITFGFLAAVSLIFSKGLEISLLST